MKKILYTLLGMMLSVGAWAQNVAKIGTTEYGTLAEAIAAAQSDETITLLADITENNTVSADKNVIIDLNGHNITVSEAKAAFTNYGTLKIQGDGNVTRSDNRGYVIDNQGTIELAGGNYKKTAGTSMNALLRNAGTMTISGGTYYAKYGNSAGTKDDYRADNIYSANLVGLNLPEGTVAKVTMIGGEFLTTTNGFTNTDKTPCVVTGGTFVTAPHKFFPDGYGVEKNAEGKYVVSNGYILTDGTNYFKTVEAAYTGTTKALSLIANYTGNIEVPANATSSYLYLNNHTVTGNITNAAAKTLILGESSTEKATSENGIVTGTISGNVKVTGGKYENDPAAFVDKYLFKTSQVGGYYVVVDKTAEEKAAALAADGIVATTGSGSTAAYFTSVQAAWNASTSTTSCQISLVADVTEDVTRVKNSAPILKLEGHSFTGKMDTRVESANKNFNINGAGTATLTEVYCGNMTIDSKANVIIEGGNVTGTLTVKSGCSLTIKGGTFKNDPTAYVAEGYESVDNGDGTFTVKAKDYVAQIGENKYESLAEAVEAANDGDVITVLAEITISERLMISKAVTIDLNGNNINANKMIYINGDGKNVTIKDSKATVAPAVDADHNVTYNSGKITTAESIFYVYNNATLTLESGTLESTGSYPVYIDDDDAAYFVMNGGYVHGAKFAISLWASTTVEINGGVIKADDQAAITGNGSAQWSTEKGTTVNVTGGTIIAKSKTSGDISCGIYNPQSGVVKISGGTIYADNGAGVVMRAGDLNITGGTIITTGTSEGLVGDAKNVVPMSAVVVDVDAKYPCNTLNDLDVVITGGTLTSAEGVDAITILNEEGTKPTTDIVSVSGATLSGPIYTTETFSMTDSEAPFAFDNYRVKKAEYTREGVSATTWGTVCLPFSISAAENGYKYYIPESVTSDELTITEITEFPIVPGTPVIFGKASGDVVITSAEATVSKTATAGKGTGDIALVGTFENKTITEGLGSIYFINGDKFHQAKASLTVPAYRAYINYSAPGAAPAVLQLVVDGEATAIADVAADLNGTQAIYDVNGRQLSAPQKGINIMKRADGKTVKLIVK